MQRSSAVLFFTFFAGAASVPVPINPDAYDWLKNETESLVQRCQITGVGGVMLFPRRLEFVRGAMDSRLLYGGHECTRRVESNGFQYFSRSKFVSGLKQ